MKTYTTKRSFRSEREAIERISVKFGIARVIEIGKDYIIEEFVDFDHNKPSLNQLSKLLRNIHHEKNSRGISLVHGDFSPHNTTVINNEVKCFDYEYSHFGNVYADIGRIILRSCASISDIESFFEVYSGGIPDLNSLREGLIYFCNWQHSLRSEKGLPYSEVPLVRKQRIQKTSAGLSKLLDAFQSEVKIK